MSEPKPTISRRGVFALGAALPAAAAAGGAASAQTRAASRPGKRRLGTLEVSSENTGAAALRFSPAELTEFTAAADAIEVRGARLPDAVLAFSEVEAPMRKQP